MLITRFPLVSGRELVTAVLHLEAYDEGEGKIAQTKAVADFIRAEYEAGNYVIAGGDFNQTFPGSRSHYPLYDNFWAPGIMDAAYFLKVGTLPSMTGFLPAALTKRRIRLRLPTKISAKNGRTMLLTALSFLRIFLLYR